MTGSSPWSGGCHPPDRRDMKTLTQRAAFAALALGGVLFNAGGMTHPGDSGEGTKVEQLHEMLVDDSWYASHILLLLSFAGFAVGALALRRRVAPRLDRLSRAVSIVAVIGVVGMTAHLMGALNADSIADGETNVFYGVQVFSETIVDTAWGLAFTALAVVGGVTRTIGNVVTAAMGLVGGAAFALASATIAFTDLFDALFPVGGLLGLWAIVIGVWFAVIGTREDAARDRQRGDLATAG